MCWLALLLVRIAETRTGTTWPAIRRELDRLHIGTFAGTFRRLTDPTKSQRDLLTRLGAPTPKQIVELTPTPRPH
uniref:hypothetical protein n=1 Tax=Nocardia amamiensis TaxID=404578 RepID=UPI00082DFC87|nr:hypothetical protein [Nocardia amamiensis]